MPCGIVLDGAKRRTYLMNPTVTIAAADPRSEAATRLIDALCAELAERQGRPPSPFLVEEAMAPRTAFVIARLDGEPVGCGALRCIDESTVEVKRMYVAPLARRRGIASGILAELERLARGFGYARIILETGRFQPEAVALYPAAGYRRILPYGRYIGRTDAHCFGKDL